MKAAEAIDKLHIAEREVPEDTKDFVAVRSNTQKWAMENARTLIFLSIMFFITWGFLIALIVGRWHK